MRSSARRLPVLSTAARVAGALLMAALSGCDSSAVGRLVIATSWRVEDRERIQAEFADWVSSHPQPGAMTATPIEWLILSPGDDPARLAGRRVPPDVLLGGPASAFERLALTGRLNPLPIDGSPAWAISRRSVIRLADGSGETPGPSSEREVDGVTFDDPRKDPISMAWMEAQLAGGRFDEGYARLVRAARSPRGIGRQAGSAWAAVRRGEARWAPRVVAVGPGDGPSGSTPWTEGVAIPSGAAHREAARRFLSFLTATDRATPPPSSTGPEPGPLGSRELLADLLGATLVDAQDELRAAWAVLERTGYPPAQLRWMTEPPPWPPASISRILGRHGESAMAMVETLIHQIATDPQVRAWLQRSWLTSPRPLDAGRLVEIGLAVDGRLLREPQFRDWLRAEWTDWARQRYRRVARAVDAARR